MLPRAVCQRLCALLIQHQPKRSFFSGRAKLLPPVTQEVGCQQPPKTKKKQQGSMKNPQTALPTATGCADVRKLIRCRCRVCVECDEVRFCSFAFAFAFVCQMSPVDSTVGDNNMTKADVFSWAVVSTTANKTRDHISLCLQLKVCTRNGGKVPPHRVQRWWTFGKRKGKNDERKSSTWHWRPNEFVVWTVFWKELTVSKFLMCLLFQKLNQLMNYALDSFEANNGYWGTGLFHLSLEISRYSWKIATAIRHTAMRKQYQLDWRDN